MGIDQYDAGEWEDKREPIPVGSYVIEPRRGGRWQVMRHGMPVGRPMLWAAMIGSIALDIDEREREAREDREAMRDLVRSLMVVIP